MKKTTKKLLSILLALTMLFGVTACLGFSAFAETSGNWRFDVLDDGTVELTDYWGDEYNVKIPSTIAGKKVTSIATPFANIFYSMETVTISESIVNISPFTFFDSIQLLTISVDKNNPNFLSEDGILYSKDKTTLIKYPAQKSDVSFSIPDGIKSISENAFYGCNNLEKIIIPNGVKNIGEKAFYDCKNLSEITVPDSVISMGYDAFYSTGYYNNKANWENGVLYIGNHLIEADKDIISGAYSVKSGTITISGGSFYDCEKLTAVSIPCSVVSMGDNLFENCFGLEKITIDTNNKNYSSANGVLYNKNKSELITYPQAKKNTSFKIPGTVTTVMDWAFSQSANLKSITLANGVKDIGTGAFEGCSQLVSIIIPNSVKSIGSWAFSDCTKLNNITISSNVTTIGENVFDNTAYSNNKVNWENGCLYIGNALVGADSDISKKISIKNGTRIICDCAFGKTYEQTEEIIYKVDNLEIPEGVQYIGREAFLSVDMNKITLPKSIKGIEEHAIGYATTYYDAYGSITSKSDDLVMYGYVGTAAEKYAKENGFKFVALSAKTDNKTTSAKSNTYSKSPATGAFGSAFAAFTMLAAGGVMIISKKKKY